MANIRLDVNGQSQTVDADPEMPLLYALRNDLGLKGPKFGCGLAQCGACTVIMDGEAIRSCVTPVAAATGKIMTLEGIGTHDDPHPVQAAFVEEQVPQCGYCISGWVMYAVAMLERNPRVTDADIRENYVGIKCRCGTQAAAIRAVKRAAESMA